jgi:hypothetical protein
MLEDYISPTINNIGIFGFSVLQVVPRLVHSLLRNHGIRSAYELSAHEISLY